MAPLNDESGDRRRGRRVRGQNKVTDMQGVNEVMGNVYFCDFESVEHEPAWPASAQRADARSGTAGIKLLVAQINAASKEIVAAYAKITGQSRQQSDILLAMVSVIDGIVSQAGIAAREPQHPGAPAAVPSADEMRELAQGAAAAAVAANELLALAREQMLHARNTARRLAEICHCGGSIE